jgi:DNA-binding response OmpR family regulator
VDDYVVKPFSSKEIMLRIAAIVRRSLKEDGADSHVIFKKDGFVADMTAHKVTVDGVQAELAPKVLDLLFYLIRNKNIAVSREKILSEVWGYTYYGDDRTLDTHMKLLRKALGPYGNLITTLRGLGYRFDEK